VSAPGGAAGTPTDLDSSAVVELGLGSDVAQLMILVISIHD
jgi:hypothetical protein